MVRYCARAHNGAVRREGTQWCGAAQGHTMVRCCARAHNGAVLREGTPTIYPCYKTFLRLLEPGNICKHVHLKHTHTIRYLTSSWVSV